MKVSAYHLFMCSTFSQIVPSINILHDNSHGVGPICSLGTDDGNAHNKIFGRCQIGGGDGLEKDLSPRLIYVLSVGNEIGRGECNDRIIY